MSENNVLEYELFLKQVYLIPVRITESSIRQLRKCSGICQNDSGCCGHFEGLGMAGDEPVARCSQAVAGVHVGGGT